MNRNQYESKRQNAGKEHSHKNTMKKKPFRKTEGKYSEQGDDRNNKRERDGRPIEKAARDSRSRNKDSEKAAWDKKSSRTDSKKAAWEKKSSRTDSKKAAWDTRSSRTDSKKAAWDTRRSRTDTEKAAWDTRSSRTDTEKAAWDKKSDRTDSGKAHWKKDYNVSYEKTALRKKGKGNSNECIYAKKCGGCRYQGVPYEMQLKNKEHQVYNLFRNNCKVYPIQGMEDPYHYRNKVHAVFGRRKDGTIISGIYEERSHRVVCVDECQIENKRADQIIYDIRGLLKSFKIRVYNEDYGNGLLRHVLIRTGHASGQIMVVLVLSSPILPSKNNFAKAILKLHPEISTIVLNINPQNTSMVLGERNIVLYGKGYIEDRLCGCVFRISPQSFYQVNPVQTEYLYNKALELAELTGSERVVDAYCGTGTIGIIASKKAKEVIGVELNKEAVRDARMNAKCNQVENIRFFQEDAGDFLTAMAETREKADVVIMDPPRQGSSEAFLSSVAKLQPKKVVYISCNPETLKRDVDFLSNKGYAPKGVWPVDLFPFTEHVEAVIMMTYCGLDKKNRG